MKGPKSNIFRFWFCIQMSNLDSIKDHKRRPTEDSNPRPDTTLCRWSTTLVLHTDCARCMHQVEHTWIKHCKTMIAWRARTINAPWLHVGIAIVGLHLCQLQSGPILMSETRHCLTHFQCLEDKLVVLKRVRFGCNPWLHLHCCHISVIMSRKAIVSHAKVDMSKSW